MEPMTKKNFFKGLATILLLPGGFILAIAVTVIFAVLLVAGIYVAILCAAMKWLLSRVHAFLTSFGKVSSVNGPGVGVARPSAKTSEGAGLPEDAALSHELEVWIEREAAHRKWLQ
jgi:hypothetical protein